jgi:hypothetical protein
VPGAEIEDFPGRRIVRHFDDDGRLLDRFEFNTLPDGKRHDLEFNAAGELIRESHQYMATKYPWLTLGIERIYQAGRLTDETYFVKGRLASRRTYERARANFPSMPAPDPSIEDSAADLLSAVSASRRTRYLRYPDPQRGRAQNDFCRKLMDEGNSADAATWVKERGHTVGEMDAAASRRLVARLMKLGCRAVTACKISRHEGDKANTRQLVVELPDDNAMRHKILRALDRLVVQQDDDGPEPPDDGQRLCYVKLD